MALAWRLCALDSDQRNDDDAALQRLSLDVARLSSDLTAGRWLVCGDDAYACGVSVLALAQVGGVAVLPPNEQPGTLATLARSVSGILTPDPSAVPHAPRRVDPLAPAGSRVATSSVPPLKALEEGAILAEMFTSGTTGDSKPIVKTVGHLGTEIVALERTLGSHIHNTLVRGTVAPQHLYGLLFRSLWPLAHGHKVDAPRVRDAKDLVQAAQSAEPFSLITTPAFLGRLGDSALASLRSTCRAIFTSGGPLDTETLERVVRARGDAPIEIFGSTETGGIAWRERPVPPYEARWNPFPGVATSQDPVDSRLRVQSAFVSDPSGSFTMGDRAIVKDDGSFELRGRADQIAKVGEKRVDLNELRSDIVRDPLVSDCALVQLKNERIGAVIRVSSAGKDLLHSSGRRTLTETLRDHLLEHWHPVLAPRNWRIVDALPTNSQGKSQPDQLRALFSDPQLPRVLSADPKRGTWSCSVPEDLVYLRGHFPESPLVPGVVQLDWVLKLAAERLDGRRVARVEALKFNEPLLPGQEFTLRVEDRADGTGLRFELNHPDGSRRFSSGRICLS